MTHTDVTQDALARIWRSAAETARELEAALAAASAVRDAARAAGPGCAADLELIELEGLRMAYAQTLAGQHGAVVTGAIVALIKGGALGAATAAR
jgi:hypothetical protein